MNHTTYSLGLDYRTKSSLQQSWRFHLSESEDDHLSNSRVTHVVLLTLSIIGAVASCADGDWAGIFTLPWAAFWAGGLADVGSSRCEMVHVTLSMFAGWITCAIVFSLAAV